MCSATAGAAARSHGFRGWGQVQAGSDLPLAQFLAEAFAAAEGTGAAAILPYKYIPFAYTYNASLFEFGTNTDAGTYAVPALVKHQADRVRPFLLHAVGAAGLVSTAARGCCCC